jgi:hypothetical protein
MQVDDGAFAAWDGVPDMQARYSRNHGNMAGATALKPDETTHEEDAMKHMIHTRETTPAAATLGVCLLLAAAAWAVPREGRDGGRDLWLAHFAGDDVVVTFVVPPPAMERAVRARLMDAEAPGVVLKLGGEEIFFSFANIISVEPARE